MKNKSKINRLIIPVITIIIFISFVTGMLYERKRSSSTTTPTTTSAKEKTLETEDQKFIHYFSQDILPLHPDLASEISQFNIVKAKPFSTMNSDKGWIIETQNQEMKQAVYLVKPNQQVKLDSPMTGLTGDEAVCNLHDILVTGDFLILSGGDCQTYGGGDFTSIYKISTGAKHRLAGNFTILNTNRFGVSASGNAQGRLRGVYGLRNSILVVDYGRTPENKTDLESISSTAFFDLQTGKLKQLIEFK